MQLSEGLIRIGDGEPLRAFSRTHSPRWLAGHSFPAAGLGDVAGPSEGLGLQAEPISIASPAVSW